MSHGASTLVLAWGNPGRLDDGLGPALAHRLEARSLPGVTVASDYQLQVEYAEEVSRHDRIVFVDADRTGGEPFWIQRLEPAGQGVSFSTHSVAPDALLALVRDLFDSEPEAWLMGIRGYEFDEFGEWLSEQARANLDEAVAFIQAALHTNGIREIRLTAPDPDPADVIPEPADLKVTHV